MKYVQKMFAGLAVLNDYLVQKKLYPKNLSSKSDTQTTFEDYEFDVFADASDDFSKETYLDDSLGGLVSKYVKTKIFPCRPFMES